MARVLNAYMQSDTLQTTKQKQSIFRSTRVLLSDLLFSYFSSGSCHANQCFLLSHLYEVPGMFAASVLIAYSS